MIRFLAKMKTQSSIGERFEFILNGAQSNYYFRILCKEKIVCLVTH